ncbi:MAG TPA: hypothetical protein VGG86_05925, partial [Roseiarcus sp.]
MSGATRRSLCKEGNTSHGLPGEKHALLAGFSIYAMASRCISTRKLQVSGKGKYMFGDKRAGQFIAIVGLSFALSAGLMSLARADDAAAAASDTKAAAKEAEPTTTKDPQIALDDLELLLEPMTKDETETEA